MDVVGSHGRALPLHGRVHAHEKKLKEVLTHYWPIFTKGSANIPTTTVEQCHSCAKETGKAKTSSAPDKERGSGVQPSVPSSTAAAPQTRKQTPTSSTPVKRAAKPPASPSEEKRKTDHRSLTSKHVWELNAATQLRRPPNSRGCSLQSLSRKFHQGKQNAVIAKLCSWSLGEWRHGQTMNSLRNFGKV